MKYIRTKDNIYEECEGEKCLHGDVATTSGVRIPYTDIIFQANTIKALCDGYYLEIDDHSLDTTQIYGKDELDKALEEKADWKSYSDRKYLEYEINLYAFIKTDKGFIFVAKVDETGDHELL